MDETFAAIMTDAFGFSLHKPPFMYSTRFALMCDRTRFPCDVQPKRTIQLEALDSRQNGATKISCLFCVVGTIMVRGAQAAYCNWLALRNRKGRKAGLVAAERIVLRCARFGPRSAGLDLLARLLMLSSDSLVTLTNALRAAPQTTEFVR